MTKCLIILDNAALAIAGAIRKTEKFQRKTLSRTRL